MFNQFWQKLIHYHKIKITYDNILQNLFKEKNNYMLDFWNKKKNGKEYLSLKRENH